MLRSRPGAADVCSCSLLAPDLLRELIRFRETGLTGERDVEHALRSHPLVLDRSTQLLGPLGIHRLRRRDRGSGNRARWILGRPVAIGERCRRRAWLVVEEARAAGHAPGVGEL